MSAFVCTDEHIAYLVAAALRYGHAGEPIAWKHANGNWRTLDSYSGCSPYVTRSEQETGAMLRDRNNTSVAALYPGRADDYFGAPVPYRKPSDLPALDPVTVLKQIDCYEYQSDNCPHWNGSEAQSFCNALRRAAVCQLPGYDAAPWGIDG